MALTKDTALRIAEVPEPYDDPADLFARAPNPGALWERMIAEAKPAPTWMIGKLGTRHDLETVRGQINACEDMVDVLVRQHPIARHVYARQLAAELAAPLESVYEMLDVAVRERLVYWREHPAERPGPPPRVVRQFPGLDVVDRYGETERFDCPWCGSEGSAKASKPLDVWMCVVCDSSGKASALRPARAAPAPRTVRDAVFDV
jgi:hypothetical protein